LHLIASDCTGCTQWPLWRSSEVANRRRDEKVLETARNLPLTSLLVRCASLGRVWELLPALYEELVTPLQAHLLGGGTGGGVGGGIGGDSPMTAPTTACFARARQAQLVCLERVCELLGAKVVLVDLQVHPVMASDGA
jgi:hypothetical protein